MPKGEHERALGEANRRAVLAQFERHADMDGLVTVSQREMADEIAMPYPAFNRAVQGLVADRRLENLGKRGVPGSHDPRNPSFYMEFRVVDL